MSIKIGLVLVLAAVPLLVGFIILLVRRPKGALALFGVGLLIGLALLAMVGFSIRSRTAEIALEPGVHVIRSNDSQVLPPVPIEERGTGVVVRSDGFEVFQQVVADQAQIERAGMRPDIFPSLRAAVEGLVELLEERCRAYGPGEGPAAASQRPLQLRVHLPHNFVATDEVTAAVTKRFPGAEIDWPENEPTGKPDTGECWLNFGVRVLEGGGRPWQVAGVSASEYSGGEISVRWRARGHDRVLTTKFKDKPWVDDWAAFVNDSAPANRHWLRAQSPGLCSSEAEARSEALNAATSLLLPYIRDLLHPGDLQFNMKPLGLSDDDLRQHIASSLTGECEKLVTDRFVQRFPRPYGDVWRHDLLIDVSRERLDELVRSCHSGILTRAEARVATERAQLRRAAGTYGSLAVLAVVILLLYAFLNVATKGYFVWRLRAAALLVAIVAVLIAFALV